MCLGVAPDALLLRGVGGRLKGLVRVVGEDAHAREQGQADLQVQEDGHVLLVLHERRPQEEADGAAEGVGDVGHGRCGVALAVREPEQGEVAWRGNHERGDGCVEHLRGVQADGRA